MLIFSQTTASHVLILLQDIVSDILVLFQAWKLDLTKLNMFKWACYNIKCIKLYSKLIVKLDFGLEDISFFSVIFLYL